MRTYPDAREGDDAYHLHGRVLPDPYRWLEDEASSETQTWVTEQAALFESVLGGRSEVVEFREIIRRQFEDGNVGVPLSRGPREFAFFRGPGREHFAVWVRSAGDQDWTCLVDPQELDPDDTTVLDGYAPSPDGRHVVVRLSRGGDEDSELWLLDASNGERVEEPITRGRWSEIEWLPDSSAFFYTARPAPDLLPAGEDQLHMRLFLHRLGEPAKGDIEIWGAGRPSTDQHFPSVSPDGRWLLVSSGQPPGTPSDIYLRELGSQGSWLPLYVGVDAEADASFGPDGRIWIRTTWHADRFRLMVADPERPLRHQWREVIAEHPTAVLRSYAVLDDVVVVTRDHDDAFKMTVHNKGSGEQTAEIPMPGDGYVGGPTRIDGTTIGGSYSDFVNRSSLFAWTVGDSEPSWQQTGRRVDGIQVTRLEYPSTDGTLVPMVLMHAGELTDPRPTIVFGYGGFGYTVTRPAYDHWAHAWTTAGGVFAIAGVRGGGEKGEAWHRAGSRENQMNTFNDFKAAADWLVEQGITTHDMVGATGSSNGATTVTATLVLHPETFAAGAPVATGPEFARSTRFDADPMTEYGDPSIQEEFAWIEQWDPIIQMRQGVDYPAFLVGSFDGDARTPAFGGHKLVAQLQAMTSSSIDERPVLLRHESGAGHAGRSVTRMVDLLADVLAFFAVQLGLEVAAPSD